MTTPKEGQELTQVGPGTVMGDLMRRYWIPAAMSSEVTADGDPVRLMLLGERLIAFRDTSGKVGVMDHRCPHRCASLFFGRNEQGGIRCVYHGWKFDTEGRCTDMPNLPAHPGEGLPHGGAQRPDLGLYGRGGNRAAAARSGGYAAAGGGRVYHDDAARV
jgi:nitrite reductase/ring-hydroxylating ferredoxin subunit